MGLELEPECAFPIFELKLEIEKLINSQSNVNEKEIIFKLKTFLLNNYFWCLLEEDSFFYYFCYFLFTIESKNKFFCIKLIFLLIKELKENSDLKKLIRETKERKKEDILLFKNKYLEKHNKQKLIDYNEKYKTFVSEFFNIINENLYKFVFLYFNLNFYYFFYNDIKDMDFKYFKKIKNENPVLTEEIKELLEFFNEINLMSNDNNLLAINHLMVFILNMKLLMKGKYEFLEKNAIKKFDNELDEIKDFRDYIDFIKNNLLWLLFEEYENKNKPEKRYKEIYLGRKMKINEKFSFHVLEMINKKEKINSKDVFIYKAIFTNQKIISFKINLDEYKNIGLNEFKLIINQKIKNINEKYPLTKNLETYIQINGEFIQFCESNDSFLSNHFKINENKKCIEDNNENKKPSIIQKDDNKINEKNKDPKFKEDNNKIENIITFSIFDKCKIDELKKKMDIKKIEDNKSLDKINKLEKELIIEKNKNKIIEEKLSQLSQLIKELENEKNKNKIIEKKLSQLII